MAFSDALRALIVGNPFGEVDPPRPRPMGLSTDGRTAAFRVLRRYISELDFYRSMGPGRSPERFRIAEEAFQIEWPDNEVALLMPSLSVTAAAATYDTIGLNAYLEPDSLDVWAPGTMLQQQSEYKETFQLQIWASKRSERRSLFAGLESQLTPTEQMYGLRLRMADYYNQTVCFTLQGRMVTDSEESARDRRTGYLEIEMRFNVVSLVNVTDLTTTVVVEDIGPEVQIDVAVAADTT
jgi:hypothetical protein